MKTDRHVFPAIFFRDEIRYAPRSESEKKQTLSAKSEIYENIRQHLADSIRHNPDEKNEVVTLIEVHI